MVDYSSKLYTLGPSSDWRVRKTDYHIHSLYSDGNDSMETCVREAVRKGLSAIAFTDHIWRTSDWVDAYVQECHKLRALYPDIHIHIGAEAKAVDLNGEIDISPASVDKLDFVIGSVHRRLPDEQDDRFNDLRSLSPETAARTEAELILSMTGNSLVDVIGHPMRLYYKFFYYSGKTSDPFPAELLNQILIGVKKSGKCIELNFNVPDVVMVIEQYRQCGVQFVLGSDAHDALAIGNIPYEVIERQCHQI